MKKNIALFAFFIFAVLVLPAQIPPSIQNCLPEGTVVIANVAYANDTLPKHLLDIYLPQRAMSNLPLIIWIHGGSWRSGDKYGDLENMKTTFKALLDSGFAVDCIDYRYSTTAVFPAQIQDCNQAIGYLNKNAAKYHLDRDRFAVMGFSAGGHLASLIAASNNQKVPGFYADAKKPQYKIKATVDFYGPSDFIARIGSMPLDEGDRKSTSTDLLGVQPLLRPDLAKWASPTTYVDKGDPPFLIFHGDQDKQVPISLSKLLDSYLTLAEVPSELVLVTGAPHGGELFGTEEIKNKILVFLKAHMQ